MIGVSDMASFKAAVRSVALKALSSGHASISAAESHAKRLDPVAQKRRIRESDPLAWSKGSEPLNYVEAFKNHKREFGASERANSGLAMEFKIVVSPDWLRETGSEHDLNNPRVKQLYDEALKWAESWGGSGSVWGLRYDTDEKGSGVVDVFMSPIREQKHKSGKSKNVISCRKAKEELLAAEKILDPSLKTSGAAMQSSWARWCQKNLDQRIERGVSKEETQIEHVHADVYAKVAEETRQVFEDHLFPDPFAPPRLPTPDEARLLAKLEAVKEKAVKKAVDDALRRERAKIQEQSAKLQKATQEANKRLSEVVTDTRRIRDRLENSNHAINVAVRRILKKDKLDLRPLSFDDAFRVSKNHFVDFPPPDIEIIKEKIMSYGGAYQFFRSFYSSDNQQVEAELKKIFDGVLKPILTLSKDSKRTRNLDYNDAEFPYLVEQFGQIACQDSITDISFEAAKRIYRSAKLGSYIDDQNSANGVAKLTAIVFAAGSVLSHHIINFLQGTFENIKNHSNAILEVNAVKEKLDLDNIEIEEEYSSSGPSM